jgi:MYXO-CTERM domain-containing protein
MQRTVKAVILAAGLGVGLFIAGTRAARAETLTATFTKPDGVVTDQTYQGDVLLHVTGVGQSYANVYNDAFYLYTNQFSSIQHGWDGGFYQLTFGTSPLPLFDRGNNAENFLVGPLPAYNLDHDYSFILNTGLTTPGQLHFGVSDGGYSDNTGAFTITVTQLGASGDPVNAPSDPEPASLAVLALGALPLLRARRRRR